MATRRTKASSAAGAALVILTTIAPTYLKATPWLLVLALIASTALFLVPISGTAFITKAKGGTAQAITRWVLASGCVLIAMALLGFFLWPKDSSEQRDGPQNVAHFPGSDSTFQLLNLSPKEQAELDRLRAPLFYYKAQLLDTPEYYKAKKAKDHYRDVVETIENRHGCLIDTTKIACLPKPPEVITRDDVDINVSVKAVAEEMSKVHFWVIRDGTTKLKVPTVIFVSLANRQKAPLKIDLLYLQARSVGGWTDIRMADTWSRSAERMDQKPLILEATNGNATMKGDYLVPALYDRVIQPGDKVEGWIIGEYPKGVKFGTSIGEIRISVLSAHRWVASKIFAANPSTYGNPPLRLLFCTLGYFSY
jgi:hypothetical protein